MRLCWVWGIVFSIVVSICYMLENEDSRQRNICNFSKGQKCCLKTCNSNHRWKTTDIDCRFPSCLIRHIAQFLDTSRSSISRESWRCKFLSSDRSRVKFWRCGCDFWGNLSTNLERNSNLPPSNQQDSLAQSAFTYVASVHDKIFWRKDNLRKKLHTPLRAPNFQIIYSPGWWDSARYLGRRLLPGVLEQIRLW